MKIRVFRTRNGMAAAAAETAAGLLKSAVAERGRAAFIAATGASQFEFLESLCGIPRGIDWSRTTMFHLDEYVGLPPDHPASFRRYLRERLVDRVSPGRVVYIDPGADPVGECDRLGREIASVRIDVAFTGIGENGHLAFNDPPADFATTAPYLLVNLDERCRRQQLGEGWFPTLESVPARAISMSIHRILLSKTILCVVPGNIKAEAVRNCLENEISPDYPASILRNHLDTRLFLDVESASLLTQVPGIEES